MTGGSRPRTSARFQHHAAILSFLSFCDFGLAACWIWNSPPASAPADEDFRTTSEAKRQLLEKGYNEKDLPSERSLCRMLGELGFKPRRAAKSKPLRKVPQTDAIFEAVHRINAAAAADPGIIRLSIDIKTIVPIGNLSRGVKSRSGHQARDHDLEPDAKLTPFGIHRPETAETWLCFTTGSDGEFHGGPAFGNLADA